MPIVRKPIPSLSLAIAAYFVFTLVGDSSCWSQTKPLDQREVALALDTGLLHNRSDQRAVIYSHDVRLTDSNGDAVPWMRLRFAEAVLGEPPIGGQATILRITSLRDGAVQLMNAVHVQQWSNTTAYFNGDGVTLAIIADAGASPSRLVLDQAWVGLTPEPNPVEDERSICGSVDDRVLSSEPANARLMTVGCTAWIISDSANCLLTAGHCTTTSTSVVQFNVPLSNSNGTVNNPPPSDQYAVDLASVQTVGSGGIGNDWKYFGCFPNSTTGLTPYQAQQAAYDLASAAPPLAGQQIRITGYGVTSAPVSPTWNQVQKTHSGPYVAPTGTAVHYQTDTTGGNSGSPVFDLSTGLCIGIHTHGTCNSDGANHGTAIHHPGLQTALANPIGVCFPQGFTILASPTSQTICAPANAQYTINIGQVGAQTDPVTLSANNVPSGASVSFSVNPVTPPGSSIMTISNTGSAPPGNFSIQVVGTTTSFTHSTNAGLSIYNATPGTPSLVSPSNGSSSVPVLPSLAWSVVPQSQSYFVQIATDAGFKNVVYSASSATANHTVNTALDTLTQYHWRVRASNPCGTGGFSAAFSFTTMDQPPILLVDDDDNSPNALSYYTAALNSLGIAYDLWDVNNNANPEPTYSQLTPYDIIIWFSGDAFGGTGNPKAGPKAATEPGIQQWLDEGGCFFLCSQDYLYDRIGFGNTTPNAFMQNYLGMGVPIAHDITQTSVTGLNVFAGFGPFALTYPFTNYSDRIPAAAGALPAFNGNQQGAAVTRDGGVYRSTFWGFPLEAVANAADRAALMGTIIAWCGKLDPPSPCPGDVNDDDLVNVNDLLAVINAWGPCSGCPTDITGDGQVNVNDLLAVINAWGPCP